jgi:hypothetical protein
MHRVLAQYEPGRDLSVREPLRNEAEDFDLARSEDLSARSRPPRTRRRPEVAQQLASTPRLRHGTDVVETCERECGLAHCRVRFIQGSEHPRELEPRTRQLEGGVARGEQLDGVLEPLSRRLLVTAGRRKEALREGN